jgi:hypothetical protein
MTHFTSFCLDGVGHDPLHLACLNRILPKTGQPAQRDNGQTELPHSSKNIGRAFLIRILKILKVCDMHPITFSDSRDVGG